MRSYSCGVRIDVPPAYTQSAIPANRDHIPTTQTASEWPYLQELATCHRVLADQGNAIIASRLRAKEIASPDDSNLLNQDFTCIEPDNFKQSLEDRRFMKTLQCGIRRTDNGHFKMPLPFRSNNPMIPDNMAVDIRRLLLLKNRLKRDKQYHTDYTDFMNDIISHGYAEEVPQKSDPPGGKVSDIPHYGVYHPKKPNKSCVVCNCSSKFNGVSLNDLLLQGPDLITGLVGVLS